MKEILAAIIIITLSEPVYAKPAHFIPDFSYDSFNASLSAGVLSGKSHEMVYDSNTGRKISQLDWKIKNVAILKGSVSWDLYSFFTLNVCGWTSLASGTGHMDDYDWLNENQPNWTDHSSHASTRVNHANEYDLNLKSWIFQDNNYKAGIAVGYQETRFSWTATGGAYNYNNGATTGNFPIGARAIGYSQRFSMPYIGLTGSYRINDFELNALLKFSDWVRAHDNDEHYMRNLTFRERSTKSRYYGTSVDAGYYITPNTKVFTEFTYSKYKEGKSGTQIIDTSSGESTYLSGDAAGISNKNYTITAGLQYKF